VTHVTVPSVVTDMAVDMTHHQVFVASQGSTSGQITRARLRR
jgi:hypothetical protein